MTPKTLTAKLSGRLIGTLDQLEAVGYVVLPGASYHGRAPILYSERANLFVVVWRPGVYRFVEDDDLYSTLLQQWQRQKVEETTMTKPTRRDIAERLFNLRNDISWLAHSDEEEREAIRQTMALVNEAYNRMTSLERAEQRRRD